MNNNDSRSPQPYFAMTQMAKKDLWRMMPVRLPSISFPTTPPTTCCDCRKIGESCSRCLSHGWFFTICCGYVVVSSLPRFSAILDFILTLAVYLTSIRESTVDLGGDVPSLGQFLHDQFKDYTFPTSVVDVVIISFVRSCILFFCFAFRYQRDGFTTPILVSVLVASISSAFLIVKMLLIKGPGLPLLLFNLIYVWAILLLFVCVRRRRIRVRPPSLPRNSSARRISVKLEGGPDNMDKYQQLTSDTHRHHRKSSSGTSNKTGGTLLELSCAGTKLHVSAADLGNNLRMNKDIPLLARATELSDSSTGSNEILLPSDAAGDENMISDAQHLPKPDAIVVVDAPPARLPIIQPEPDHKRDTQKKQHNDGQHLRPSDAERYGSVARLTSPSYGSVPGAEFNSQAERILAEPDSQFVTLDGLNVHYRVCQRPDSEKEQKLSQTGGSVAVILLHGFGGGVFQWRRIWSELSRKCDILLAFDRPGFGLTSKPINGRWEGLNPYTIEFSVNLTLHMMDYFKIDEAVIVGHSTGASVACMCAIHSPERVAGLVLAAHSHGLPKFIRSILKTKLGGPIIMRLVRSEIGDVAIRRAWHDPDSIPQETIRSHKESIKVKHWGKALLEMARVSGPTSVDEHYSDMTCPVLMIHGEEDKLVPLAESQRLIRKFENCELVRFDDCGHIPHEENPTRFVVEVDAFLSKIQEYAYHANLNPEVDFSAGDDEQKDSFDSSCSQKLQDMATDPSDYSETD